MNWTDSIKGFVVGAAAASLLFAGLWAWNEFQPSLPASLGETPNEIASTPTETVPCKTAQALPSSVKEDIGLPPAVVKNEQERLIAVVNVPQVDFPMTAGALLNTDTGMGQIYFTPQPYPWTAFNPRWTFGGFYGINDKESGVVMGQAHYQFVQVKRLHVTATGQVDTSSRWFIGVGGQF